MQPPTTMPSARARPRDPERWPSRELEHAGRIVSRAVARGGRTSPHRWGARVRPSREGGAPGRAFFYASCRSSNEAAFLLQCFGACTAPTTQHLLLLLPSASSGLADAPGAARDDRLDDPRTPTSRSSSSQPGSNHPRLARSRRLRRRGGKVRVINRTRIGLQRLPRAVGLRSMLLGRTSGSLPPAALGSDVALPGCSYAGCRARRRHTLRPRTPMVDPSGRPSSGTPGGAARRVSACRPPRSTLRWRSRRRDARRGGLGAGHHHTRTASTTSGAREPRARAGWVCRPALPAAVRGPRRGGSDRSRYPRAQGEFAKRLGGWGRAAAETRACTSRERRGGAAGGSTGAAARRQPLSATPDRP